MRLLLHNGDITRKLDKIYGAPNMRFLVLVFCTDQPYIDQRISLMSIFFICEFADKLKFLSFGSDSVAVESQFPINKVNAE